MTTTTAGLLSEILQRLTGRVPTDRIRTAIVSRHPATLVEELLALPDISSGVADALDELGRGAVLSRSQLTPLGAGQRAVGPAVTLRYVPVDGDASCNRDRGAGKILGDRDLYGVGQAGDIAVIDASAALPYSVVGGLSAAWAHRAGLSACITDGAVRDSDSVLKTSPPVWSAERSPRAGRYRMEAVEINGPVALAGAVVHPGDYVVADGDGVCIIPHDLFPSTVRMCVESQSQEQALLATIASAETIEELVAHTSDASTV